MNMIFGFSFILPVVAKLSGWLSALPAAANGRFDINRMPAGNNPDFLMAEVVELPLQDIIKF